MAPQETRFLAHSMPNAQCPVPDLRDIMGIQPDVFEEVMVSLVQQIRKVLTALILVLVLTVATACGGAPAAQRPANPPAIASSGSYAQLERGNTPAGQDFGSWALQTAKGLIQDAYVRDNNKLGVVISPQVRPNEVKTLAKSLAQGFHKNFPNQDLTVLIYAPDKQLILTAKYDQQSNQIEYKAAPG